MNAHIDTAQIETEQPDADALVLFGATGDLAKRKLFPALYRLQKSGALHVPVIGVARSDWTDDDFRTHAKESIEEHIDDADQSVIAELCGRMDLVQGDYSDEATWNELSPTLDKVESKVAVFYMAIPPTMFPTVAHKLASVDLHRRGRIVVEKPFGRDLASAIELNKTLHAVFPEDHIFRIDHYLGKEAVEDLLVFRFANTLLEPVWNRNYVRSVQVTMSETIGVEGRGPFYDSVGAIRDVLQNHLLQVVALLAMEPPAGSDSGFLQDEKAKVIAAMRPMDAEHARARAVRRLPRRARCRAGVRGRDVRRGALRDRLVAMGRRALVRPGRQGVGAERDRGRHRAARTAAHAVRRGRRPAPGTQPDPTAARRARRGDVRAPGQDAGAAPRQPERRRQRRLRRCARRTTGRLRATDR